MSVSPDQHTHHSGASIGNRERLFHWRNRLFGLTIRDERVAEIPQGTGIVGLQRDCNARLLDSFGKTVGKEEKPGKIGVRDLKRVEFATATSLRQRLIGTPLNRKPVSHAIMSGTTIWI